MTLSGRSPRPAILRIKPRNMIWSVTLDNKFYGDYRRREFAIAGAEEKARAIRAKGLAVEVQILSEDGSLLKTLPLSRF